MGEQAPSYLWRRWERGKFTLENRPGESTCAPIGSLPHGPSLPHPWPSPAPVG